VSAAPSRWRASPARLAALLVGLALFGAGEALLVAAELGNSPWTVLAEGLGEQVGVGVGVTTVAVSGLILLAWVPLHQTPGLGTLLNAVLVGVALDLTLLALPPVEPLALRWAALAGGIALVALGSGAYLGTRLGPGPRDGLMTGLHRRTGVSVRAVRGGIELSAVAVGAVLGGTVGVGTLAFALLIGPAVQVALGVLSPVPASEL
jgi:uncharacterized membrane protein YczE